MLRTLDIFIDTASGIEQGKAECRRHENGSGIMVSQRKDGQFSMDAAEDRARAGQIGYRHGNDESVVAVMKNAVERPQLLFDKADSRYEYLIAE